MDGLPSLMDDLQPEPPLHHSPPPPQIEPQQIEIEQHNDVSPQDSLEHHFSQLNSSPTQAFGDMNLAPQPQSHLNQESQYHNNMHESPQHDQVMLSPQKPQQQQQQQPPPPPPPPPQPQSEPTKIIIDNSAPDKNSLVTMLKLLRQYNLKETEQQLKKEINVGGLGFDPSDAEIGDLLASYKSEGDPNLYEDAYKDLRKFIENSLDIYKYELGLVLYPVLVHMYIELIYNGHEKQAADMLKKHIMDHEPHYQEDLKKLGLCTKRDQIRSNEIAEIFRSTEFIVRISRDTLSILKRHLQEKKHSVLLSIVQEHLFFDLYEGISRTKAHIASVSGGLIGEATRADNKTKIYYGMPKEPDLHNSMQIVDDDEEEPAPDGEKPKKKKKKDSLFNKKGKSDPNAPPVDRMPLPPLRDSDKVDKVKALREAMKRVTLGPDTLPSIACYTLLNSHQQVTCAEVSEDVSILAVGFSESYIKLWSLVPQKLKAMKSADQLQDIEMECDDILVRIMDERSAETTRTLVGHEGPIRKLSFSPDRSLLVSCSQDTTIRLWSLLLWKCLVVFKGHLHPIWDIKFSPHGHYFVSGGHDRIARLWSTDSHIPLRLFVGHYSDVECVQFHPNSNYVATGSSDRTIRLWDCVTGNFVRLLTGHKGSIYVLTFSICGRFLASAGTDKDVYVWDLANGSLVTMLTGHTAVIRTLSFSRDGNILASGGQDCSVKLWDFTKLTEDIGSEELSIGFNADTKNSSNSYLVRSYVTKSSPLLNLIFSRRNILLAVAIHDSS